MNFRSLRSEIEHSHRDNPSLALKLDSAMREIEQAMGVLSAAGHHFHLGLGHSPHVEYPKYVYHYVKGQKLVRSEWELKDLGPGWFPSLRDAQYAEGLDVQFAGRGGVRRRQLPLPAEPEAHFVETSSNEERIAAWKSVRPSNLGPILSDSKVE